MRWELIILATITKISAQKRAGRYNIFLDGHYAFPVSEEILIKFVLHKGQEIDEAFKNKLLQAEVNAKAYQLALHYLSYQLRTISEMKTYLRDHEVEAEVINEVIARLQKQQLLDDHAYAKAYVRTQLRLSLKGPYVLQRELQRKGIRDADIIEEALALFDDDMIVQKGQKLAMQVWQRQKRLSARAREQKIRQRLQTKGYRAQDIDLIWPQLTLTVDQDDEAQALDQAARKAYRHYQPQQDPRQAQKFKQSLVRKGFDYQAINTWLNDQMTQDRD